MTENQLREKFWDLTCVLSDINNPDTMYAFIRDLCTIDEMEEFTLRRNIAKLLHCWDSYVDIQKCTWASSTTIARVAKYLNWPFKWYKTVLDEK